MQFWQGLSAFGMVLLTLAGLSPAFSASVPPLSPIILGEYGPLNSAKDTRGLSADRGIRLAVAQINAQGGIDGHLLRIKRYDDGGLPDRAQEAVRTLVTQDQASVVIGGISSVCSIAAAPICDSAMVPMISPTATYPELTQIGPYVFRACVIDAAQGAAGARFAARTLQAKKAAILQDTSSDYSAALGQSFLESFRSKGRTIVSTQTYTAGDLDFKPQLLQIKAMQPDVLYLPGDADDLGSIVRQARSLGLTIPVIGGDGWSSPALLAGPDETVLEGCYFTDHVAVQSPDVRMHQFVQDFKARYHGDEPDAVAALSYDAVGMFRAAVQRAGTPPDGDYHGRPFRIKVRDALALTKNYPGVSGSTSLDTNRDALKPLVIYQIHDRHFQYFATVPPARL